MIAIMTFVAYETSEYRLTENILKLLMFEGISNSFVIFKSLEGSSEPLVSIFIELRRISWFPDVFFLEESERILEAYGVFLLKEFKTI